MGRFGVKHGFSLVSLSFRGFPQIFLISVTSHFNHNYKQQTSQQNDSNVAKNDSRVCKRICTIRGSKHTRGLGTGQQDFGFYMALYGGGGNSEIRNILLNDVSNW